MGSFRRVALSRQRQMGHIAPLCPLKGLGTAGTKMGAIGSYTGLRLALTTMLAIRTRRRVSSQRIKTEETTTMTTTK